jgi:hypothetical protein
MPDCLSHGWIPDESLGRSIRISYCLLTRTRAVTLRMRRTPKRPKELLPLLALGAVPPFC